MAIVTISRQVGSFGDEIAEMVARRLGHQLIDRHQFQRLAEERDPDFKAAVSSRAARLDPRFHERFFFENPGYTCLFESLIYELASLGQVVIVGRGAQVVLREVPGVFKARVVAPLEIRVKRVMADKGVSLEEASGFVSRYDHERRAIIQSIYHKDLTDWYLYDMILNTALFDPEAGAGIICEAVMRMETPADQGMLGEELTHMAFAKRVESAIKKRFPISPFRQLDALASRGGHITLSGYVPHPSERDAAEEIARGVEGVTGVLNQLKVTMLHEL